MLPSQVHCLRLEPEATLPPLSRARPLVTLVSRKYVAGLNWTFSEVICVVVAGDAQVGVVRGERPGGAGEVVAGVAGHLVAGGRPEGGDGARAQAGRGQLGGGVVAEGEDGGVAGVVDVREGDGAGERPQARDRCRRR